MMQQLTKNQIVSELESGVSLLVKQYKWTKYPMLDDGNPWCQDFRGNNSKCLVTKDSIGTEIKLDRTNRIKGIYAENLKHTLCSTILDYLRHNHHFNKRCSFDEKSNIFIFKEYARIENNLPLIVHITKKNDENELGKAFDLVSRIRQEYGLKVAVLEYRCRSLYMSDKDLLIKGFKAVELLYEKSRLQKEESEAYNPELSS